MNAQNTGRPAKPVTRPFANNLATIYVGVTAHDAASTVRNIAEDDSKTSYTFVINFVAHLQPSLSGCSQTNLSRFTHEEIVRIDGE